MKVALVNVPFASIHAPSLALTQLRAMLEGGLKGQVETSIHYLNQDFALWFGINIYQEISNETAHLSTGIGDWLFRQVAFPELADNSDVYFTRYYRERNDTTEAFRRVIKERRASLSSFLDDLIDRYALADADIVGLSTTFAQSTACLALARMLKARRPEIVTVLGGANCEHPMGLAWLEAPQIDYVFSGPALKSLPEFVRRRLNGDNSIDDIAGIVSRKSSATISPSGDCPPVRGEELPLDVPVPLDYDEFVSGFKHRFRESAGQPMLLFETSRGCWWGQKSHCTFCGLNGATMAYRAMPPDLALEQFERLFKYVDDVSRFQCVDNILPREYLRDVLPKLRTPPGANIFYEVKADLTAEDLRVLAEAGVRLIQPGVESLSTSTLKLMRKGTSAFTNVRLLMNCALQAVRPTWAILVGFPGESRDVYEKYIKDIPSLRHLFPPSGMGPVRFDRFSPYFMQAEHYQLQLEPLDFYELTYPFAPETIERLAYYFADGNIEAPYIEAMTSIIDPLRRVVTDWEHRYNGVDGLLPASLYFVADRDGTHVHDTRDGQLREIPLDPPNLTILQHLTTPRRTEEVLGFIDQPAEEVMGRLRWLHEMGFLFAEGDRFMSLVLPQATKQLVTRGELVEEDELPHASNALGLSTGRLVGTGRRARA